MEEWFSWPLQVLLPGKSVLWVHVKWGGPPHRALPLLEPAHITPSSQVLNPPSPEKSSTWGCGGNLARGGSFSVALEWRGTVGISYPFHLPLSSWQPPSVFEHPHSLGTPGEYLVMISGINGNSHEKRKKINLNVFRHTKS